MYKYDANSTIQNKKKNISKLLKIIFFIALFSYLFSLFCQFMATAFPDLKNSFNLSLVKPLYSL